MTTSTAADRFDTFWAQASDADRLVLLGHTRPVLDADDKVRLAARARASVSENARSVRRRRR